MKIKFLKISGSILMSFALLTLSYLPLRYIFQISNVQFNKKNINNTIKPASEMFLGNELVEKVYAGQHTGSPSACFSENNNPPWENESQEPACIYQYDDFYYWMTAGCTLNPNTWRDTPDFILDPWDGFQIVASFASYDDADNYFSDNTNYICYGESEPAITYLDIQYYDDQGEIENGGTPPEGGEHYYLYTDGGTPSVLSDSITLDDGTLQIQGDDPSTEEFEGVWLLLQTFNSDENYAYDNLEAPFINCNDYPQYQIVELINNPPVADAGDDQTVTEGESVQLDGTNSTDEDLACQNLTYLWTQIDDSGYLLSNDVSMQLLLADPTNPIQTLTAPDIGSEPVTLTFRLTTSDGQFSDDDEINVIIEPLLGEYCGDGIQQDNEECDDGNTSDNDSCSADCQLEEVLYTQCQNHEDYIVNYSFGNLEWWNEGSAPPQNIDCTWEQTQGSLPIVFDSKTQTILANSDSQYPLEVSTSITFDTIPSDGSEVYGIRVRCGGLISETEYFDAQELINCCLVPVELPDTGENKVVYITILGFIIGIVLVPRSTILVRK